MAGEGAHPRDAIHDLIDGRLDPARQVEVESHLALCDTCRREADAMSSLKHALREGLPEIDLPEGLEDELAAALDGESGQVAARGQFGSTTPASVPRRAVMRAVLITAAAAAAAVVAIWLMRSSEDPRDIAGTLAEDFDAIAGARLAIDLAVTDPVKLEGAFTVRGIPFPTHVYDLTMMDFRLAGGRVHQVDGRPSALFAYRSGTGAWLVCQMFQGEASELPAGARQVAKNGFEFQVYRRERVTVVVWAEGRVLCALASDLPEAAVLELAIAKAMKV
jgi:anti-sigma factor RsiW